MSEDFSLTVLTYNVLQLPLLGSSRRAGLATRVLAEADTDIVVLNEAFNRPAHKLADALGRHGYTVTPEVGSRSQGWTSSSGRRRRWGAPVGGGILVASRLPVVEQHQHRYRAFQTWTSDALSDKGVALVALATPKGPLWVAATHLQADERGSRQEVRLRQVAELRQLVDRTVPAEEPVLIAGDLNVEYYTAGKNGEPEAPGPQPAEVNRALGGEILTGVIHDPTFDGRLNEVVPDRFRAYCNVLDYIGTVGTGRRPLKITTQTITGGLTRQASDHFPVIATVTIM